MITRTFKLCLNAGTCSAPYINVSQYDEGETWLFELYSETGERYIPSTGAIVGVKSDGHGIINTGTVDSEGRVVITETQQMTASAGRAIFELSIDGLTHGTANFVVAVERKPTDDAVMSDSDLSLIQEAVDAAETIEDLIEGHDPDEVIADAVDDWLDAHPEATTTVQDGAITSAKLNDSVKTGVFEDMTVGTSLAVMNDEGTTDNLAYKFRQTGGDAVRELDEIHGGTIAWNQLASLDASDWGNFHGTKSVSGNTITLTVTNASSIKYLYFAVPTNHKYYVSGTFTSATDAAVFYGFWASGEQNNYTWRDSVVAGGSATAAHIVDAGGGGIFRVQLPTSAVEGDTCSAENLQVIDLTQMFGSTVADAIYAMEQSSQGSGVAYFRSLFPNSYYAYNAGELVSVEGLSAHETIESNIFGGDYLADTIDEKVPNATKNTTNKTVTFAANYVSNKVLYDKFKPNTQYTIILYGKNTISSNATNLMFTYTDGSQQPFSFASSSAVSYCVATSNSGRSIKDLRGVWATGSGVLYYEQCGLFEGVLTEADFKPYKKHTYPLDSSLTLRGVPKWNNGLYFDGDIYRHDGSVTRRYGVVDLGSLTWTNGGSFKLFFSTGLNALIRKASANTEAADWIFLPNFTPISYNGITGSTAGRICVAASGSIGICDGNTYSSVAEFKTAMSGVYLVYELATPTAETADPYQQYQICDGKGTEEYVSETVTPVGHNTFYPVDIVAKVNKLPSDFSTLIAPTEEGFKATRNYTAKQFLIINNQLYRVTANIANGANIVPNTNVTAVTIADILTTLI